MSSVGTFKSLLVCAILAGSCFAQKAITGPVAGVRPAIIQRGAQGAQIVASPGRSNVQLSSASFHVASDEEIVGMEKTLEQYVAAFESLDLSQVRNVWPELDRQHEKALKSAFGSFKAGSSKPQLGLQCAIPAVNADTATVECMETVTYAADRGTTKQVGPARISIHLKGQSGRWLVQDMKGSG